jgi:DNA-binding transcriptional LysR family regulator
MDASIAGQAPLVEPVLPEKLAVDFPVWLATHREIHNSPRIRLVFDHLAEVLARV